MSDMSSDQPLGPGWWMASDGRYYPPSLHSDPAHQAAYAAAEPAQMAQPVVPTQPVAPTQPAVATQPVVPTQPIAPAVVSPPVVGVIPDDLSTQTQPADPFAFPQSQATPSNPIEQPVVPQQPEMSMPTPQAHSFAIPGEQTAYPTATPTGSPDQTWGQVPAPQPVAPQMAAPAPAMPAQPAPAMPVQPTHAVVAPIPQTPPVNPQPMAPGQPPVAPMPIQPPAPQGGVLNAGPVGALPGAGMGAVDASTSKLSGLKTPLVLAGAGLFGLLCAVALGSMLFGGGGGDPVASPDSLPMIEGAAGEQSADGLADGVSGGAMDAADGASGDADLDADPAGAPSGDAAGGEGVAGGGGVADPEAAQAYVQWAGGDGAAVSEGVAELLTLVTAMDGQLAAGPSAELDASCAAAEQRSAGLLADPTAFPYASDPDEIHRQHVQDFAEATKRAASLCLVGDLPGAVENAAAAIASSWEMNDREFTLLEQQ